ncbi:hypothetical protein H257_16450 [Aphanomyces astaci]|uniref:Uncharacterized protein n=1 Tax=Aphanomyces astaci TaxID=112090 RepID=W4FKH1_APHAT|nr:hypothetical protein H257_16450 [Aphanomyces astaci]ETV67366.1 hypothetical protein H257_16450 [Aphanomyces astaci]RQM10015.1 hypothetical protein B5M09_012262 [Aphanomyces astaci]|eukprot:XP_009843181.1 hypothetical protein H257_16450 [Aphanomyces astaci]
MRTSAPLSALVLANYVLLALSQTTTTTITPTISTTTSTRPGFKPNLGPDSDDAAGSAPLPLTNQGDSTTKSVNLGVDFAIGISVFILFVLLALLRAVYVQRKQAAAEVANTPIGDYSKLEDSK